MKILLSIMFLLSLPIFFLLKNEELEISINEGMETKNSNPIKKRTIASIKKEVEKSNKPYEKMAPTEKRNEFDQFDQDKAHKNSFQNLNKPEEQLAPFPEPEPDPEHDYNDEPEPPVEEEFMDAPVENLENYEDDMRALHDQIPENTPLPLPDEEENQQ